MVPKRKQPHLINQDEEQFVERLLYYDFIEIPYKVQGINKFISYIKNIKLEDSKISKVQKDIITLIPKQWKVFDNVGLMNLLIMSNLCSWGNTMKFIYNHYNNNKLWLDKPYVIIGEVVEWVIGLNKEGSTHDHLTMRRNLIKATTIQSLLCMKINTKAMKLRLIIL